MATLALATTAALASASLVVLTTSLDAATTMLSETLGSVRRAREVEIDLLVLAQTQDVGVRQSVENEIRETMETEARLPASSPDASRARDVARAQIEHYLDATAPPSVGRPSQTTPALVAAQAALDRLVRVNVRDAHAATARAARLNAVGDVIGVISATLLVTIPILLAWWIRGAVLRPMFALSDAMDRFRFGDLSARATPTGAAELQRMSAQFNVMSEALARQHEYRLTHLAGVAHDLRNPLAALQMASSLVEPGRPLPSESRIRQSFGVLHRQVGRLGRMVQDLLDATRIEAGQLSLQLEEKDLRVVIAGVADLFKDASDAHRVTVVLPEEPLVVRCDPLRIEQALTNLVSNAIKYSPRGGAVRIVACRDDETVKVSVSDEGMGIAEAEIGQIWEPFARKGISAETIPGVGLGLWTARQIAEAHHGSITVRSKLGQGSTFTLALPSAPQPPHAQAKPAAATSSELTGALGRG